MATASPRSLHSSPKSATDVSSNPPMRRSSMPKTVRFRPPSTSSTPPKPISSAPARRSCWKGTSNDGLQTGRLERPAHVNQRSADEPAPGNQLRGLEHRAPAVGRPWSQVVGRRHPGRSQQHHSNLRINPIRRTTRQMAIGCG